jgi:hypothetical protein
MLREQAINLRWQVGELRIVELQIADFRISDLGFIAP